MAAPYNSGGAMWGGSPDAGYGMEDDMPMAGADEQSGGAMRRKKAAAKGAGARKNKKPEVSQSLKTLVKKLGITLSTRTADGGVKWRTAKQLQMKADSALAQKAKKAAAAAKKKAAKAPAGRR